MKSESFLHVKIDRRLRESAKIKAMTSGKTLAAVVTQLLVAYLKGK